MSVNRLIGAACAIALGLAPASASADVMVGGSAMLPQKNIVQNAVNSKDHTTLVAAVKAAGLVDTLQSKGPFTVFAPVNAAFDALPAGTVDTLLKPENKATLTKVLTYHVVPGRLTATELDRLIKQGNGTAELTTASGGKLWVMKNGDRNITIKDEAGADRRHQHLRRAAVERRHSLRRSRADAEVRRGRGWRAASLTRVHPLVATRVRLQSTVTGGITRKSSSSTSLTR